MRVGRSAISCLDKRYTAACTRSVCYGRHRYSAVVFYPRFTCLLARSTPLLTHSPTIRRPGALRGLRSGSTARHCGSANVTARATPQASSRFRILHIAASGRTARRRWLARCRRFTPDRSAVEQSPSRATYHRAAPASRQTASAENWLAAAIMQPGLLTGNIHGAPTTVRRRRVPAKPAKAASASDGRARRCWPRWQQNVNL